MKTIISGAVSGDEHGCGWCLSLVMPVAAFLFLFGIAPVAAGAEAGAADATADVIPGHMDINLPRPLKHPCIACTPQELDRLRRAYAGEMGRDAQRVVKGRVSAAQKRMKAPLVFPPRGGQHNQWYHCDKCEVRLVTVDAQHHKCPRCGKVYSGYPYDDVLFARTHNSNLNRMLACAWAYAITGDEVFAGEARRVLLGYAKRYRLYPLHGNSMYNLYWIGLAGGHLYEQTLNEACVMALKIAPAFDLVAGSTAMSDDDCRQVVEGLIKPMLWTIGKYNAGRNNWQTWHNAGMLAGGAVIGDQRWVDRAVNDKRNGFIFQMRTSVTCDGMWYEGSWGYHKYALCALVATAESARRLGIDLWHVAPLKKMFLLPLSYTMPDGSLPRFGDDVNTGIRNFSRELEPAYHALRHAPMLAAMSQKPAFLSVLYGRACEPAGKTNPQPAQEAGSLVVPGAGHLILRAHGPGGLAVAATFGKHGGYHGHYDKLSFVLFGFGRELGVDPGRAASQAYRLPIHKHWYKATISHNTVLVDGESQLPATGRLLAFRTEAGYAAGVMECDQAYRGVRHTRLLCLGPGWLLVHDWLRSQKQHTYSWLYHNRAGSVDASSVNTTLADANTGKLLVGLEYARDMRQGQSAEAWQVRFRGQQASVLLHLEGGANTTVLVGTGPGKSIAERIPMTMATRTGGDAWFTALLVPYKTGDGPQAQVLLKTAMQPGRTLITVLHGNRSFVCRLDWEEGSGRSAERACRIGFAGK